MAKPTEILTQDADAERGIEPYRYVMVGNQSCRVYEVPLPTGKTITFRELTVQEFEACMKEGGTDGWAIATAGLRRSLLFDGETALSYEHLMGGLLAARFRLKEMMILRAAWDRVNMITEEDMAVVRDLRVG